MKKLIISVLVIGFCHPTLVMAQGLPRYDPRNYCKTVSDFSGGSNMIFNTCVDMEQRAYDAMKHRWGSIPAKTQSYCDEVASFAGSSYAILQSCLDMETEAGASAKDFKF